MSKKVEYIAVGTNKKDDSNFLFTADVFNKKSIFDILTDRNNTLVTIVCNKQDFLVPLFSRFAPNFNIFDVTFIVTVQVYDKHISISIAQNEHPSLIQLTVDKSDFYDFVNTQLKYIE